MYSTCNAACPEGHYCDLGTKLKWPSPNAATTSDWGAIQCGKLAFKTGTAGGFNTPGATPGFGQQQQQPQQSAFGGGQQQQQQPAFGGAQTNAFGGAQTTSAFGASSTGEQKVNFHFPFSTCAATDL